MKELKCPKCGNVFQVDEADYASILSQVKTAEFEAELKNRLAEMASRQKAEHQLASAKAEQDYRSKLNEKEKALGAKDAEIAQIQAAKNAEIEQLKSKISNFQTEMQLALSNAMAEKDKTIASLQSTIQQHDANQQIAIMQEQQKMQQQLQTKENEISRLKSEAEIEKSRAVAHETELKETFKSEKDAMQKLIDYYKDMKAKLSTKMVGETLEIHCSTQYNQLLRSLLPNAYFEKDNDASGGTKGDFIFRDFDDGLEYISIMFEMKNEMETTESKHKNEDFFKKLDDDRRKKNCEYAVLVSLLEPDSDLYNGGIVDVSYKYEKMYVIRPQFFIPLITLLVQTSKKSIEYKRQLTIAQSKEVDVTNFENRMNEFKQKFGDHYTRAHNKFMDVIKDIDDTIKKLQKTRDDLMGSDRYLSLASKDTENLTIRKLTYKNPTMKAKFEKAKSDSVEIEEIE